jgi:hypothetical protein
LTTGAARLVRFTLRLEGFEDEHTAHELRAILKALRRRGFRCVSVREEVMGDHEAERDERSNDAVSARDRMTGKA